MWLKSKRKGGGVIEKWVCWHGWRRRLMMMMMMCGGKVRKNEENDNGLGFMFGCSVNRMGTSGSYLWHEEDEEDNCGMRVELIHIHT